MIPEGLSSGLLSLLSLPSLLSHAVNVVLQSVSQGSRLPSLLCREVLQSSSPAVALPATAQPKPGRQA